MIKAFYPDAYLDSVKEINFESYYSAGYRGIIFECLNLLSELNKICQV